LASASAFAPAAVNTVSAMTVGYCIWLVGDGLMSNGDGVITVEA
jgi:hypothetical protein